ncbi:MULTISPECIES: SDR family oxidoreductase [Phenylobacterium]|uniref:Nucleoside-diphosphate-sugar epimerase n=1 Tax=Phenylobacterium koreense TaxID=266125 RepID=A0ABV2EFZ7_9CAUL
MRLLIYGYGFAGKALARRMAAKGWAVSATYRDPEAAAAMRADGIDPVPAGDKAAIAERLGRTQAVLVATPPGPEGCPALQVLVPALARAGAFPDWIGYLSTTGVYGDRRGGWVFEESSLAARSPEGARRVAAERDWLEVGRGMGLTVTVHRLPGIYGPGRSAFDRLRDGRAIRYALPGHVFSRIHVEDLAAGLEASIARPRAGGIYNLCDDEPAPNSAVIAYAAQLLGVEAPPERLVDFGAMPPQARRFYDETKRVSNAKAKAELGWRPAFPTYREGLAAILKAGG